MANTDFQNGVVLGSVAGGNIQTSAPSGNIEITENGDFNISAYETATVNVASGGGSYDGVAISPMQSIAQGLSVETTITIS